MRSIRILHVFLDDKFFDGRSNFFDSIEGVENLYYFFSTKKKIKFKYIKNKSKIIVVNNVFKYLGLFMSKNIDMVLFHSLPTPFFLFFPFISRRKIVIWWAWGYDIYNSSKYLPSIIQLELYKPLTDLYYNDHKCTLRSKWPIVIKQTSILKFVLGRMRMKAISRIDYMIPVLPIDYNLLKESCTFFRGKELINGCLPHSYDFRCCKEPKCILVGNSLTYSNNHLDIFEKLYNIELDENRKFIVPISYGDAYGGPDGLIKMSRFKTNQVVWLRKFVDKSEYHRIYQSISHAVFGVIRQQAMGNIYFCLRNGIKLFLYKDSMVYRQLKDWGYIVYTIDEDLNEKSLSEVLTRDEARINYDIYIKIMERRSSELMMEQLYNISKKRIV